MEVVIGLLALVLLGWLWWRHRARKDKAHLSTPSEKTVAHRPPIRTITRPDLAAAPPRSDGPRFAVPGMRGPLFMYGGPAAGTPGYRHDGPYAIVDVETTGFSPNRGDRVIEIAIARVDAFGRVEDEYATLLSPEGRDTGPVFVHGISNESVRDAPTFRDVAGDILARLEGAVLVAHNAIFEERFLAAEFARAGIKTGPVPALCTLWLAQRTLAMPNYKLATLARHRNIPLVDAHAALGDVRAVAGLLPDILSRHRTPLIYGCGPLSGAQLTGWPRGIVRPRTRAVAMRRGTEGWMASLVARLPMSGADVSDVDAAAYLDALSVVLEDGKIIGDEAKSLARLAGSAGLGAAQVAALNERYLEAMREAALDDQVLTVTELRELRNAAKALGAPDYFDDLHPHDTDPAQHAASAHDPNPASTPRPTKQRRCGHCREVGHYRPKCPQLV